MLRRLRIENLVLIRDAELELSPGLNAITGETGAGKTILAQAVDLLLGARADSAAVGPGAAEAYVEAELDLPDDVLDDEGLEALADLRPADDDGLVLARRITAEGRSRAYAWGRSVAREDAGGLAERLIAMSGQYEQRRLARLSYQLDVLDAFCGDDQLRRRRELRGAWRELLAARRRRDELERGREADEARLSELRALAEATEGLEPGDEDALRAESERFRHVAELGAAAATAANALSPSETVDDHAGAVELSALAAAALAPVARVAPELEATAAEIRDSEFRLREVASELRSFLTTLEADPARLDEVEERLVRIADAKRRFACASYEELLARAAQAKTELDAAEAGDDPRKAAERALAEAEARADALTQELRTARRAAAEPFAAAVAEELRQVGVGEGEFVAELRVRDAGPSGADEVAFLIRPNPGLPLVPVAETASGGELSRIALAIAAVSGGTTMIFDEIDAGIGGQTAHAVAETLRRLSERAQVVTITHLPQIASRADRHFRVEKVPGDPTHTRIELLDEEARREELERMLGGAEFISSVQ